MLLSQPAVDSRAFLFQDITEAYSVLSDEQKRRRFAYPPYDATNIHTHTHTHTDTHTHTHTHKHTYTHTHKHTHTHTHTHTHAHAHALNDYTNQV
jgi:hypothetical protein